MSVVILLEMKVKPEHVEETKSFFKKILVDTRAYAGCTSLDFYSNLDEPTNFVIHEQWQSREHYQKYLAWRNENGSLKPLGDKLAGPPNIRYFDRLDV